MTTLYLDRKNLSLRADSSALVCYEMTKSSDRPAENLTARLHPRGFNAIGQGFRQTGRDRHRRTHIERTTKTPRPHAAQLETGRTKTHGTICPVAR